MANALRTEKKVQSVSLLCEGSSIRSIARVTGIHRDTIRLWTEIEQEGLDKLKAGPTAGGQTQAPQDLPKP